MEHAVVDAKVGRNVVHRHGGSNTTRAANADSPIEVLVPVGAVAATYVTHSSGVVAFAQQRLTQAGALVKLVGQAAVAYHQAEFLVVGHRGDMGSGEVGCAPAGGTTMGAVVDESGALVVIAAHRSRHAVGVAGDGDVGGASRGDGGVVLEIAHIRETLCAIDVVGDGIIHCGVGMGVAEVATGATVDTGHHHRTVEERGVGKGVLLIHQGLLHLGRQLRHILRREAAVVAVGKVVASGPCHIIEVGDVFGRGDAGEGRQLCHIAHQQHIGGSRAGGGGLGVLTLDVGRYRCRGGAHSGVVGVDDVRDEAFAALPLHEGVQMAAEHAVGHDEVAHGGGGADSLGVESVDAGGTAGEGRRIVAVEHLLCSSLIHSAIAHRHFGATHNGHLAADGVVADGIVLQARQTAVAGDAQCFHIGGSATEEHVVLIDPAEVRQLGSRRVALAARGLHVGQHRARKLQGVVFQPTHNHLEVAAQRHLDNLREGGQCRSAVDAQGQKTLEAEGAELLPADGGGAHHRFAEVDLQTELPVVVGYHTIAILLLGRCIQHQTRSKSQKPKSLFHYSVVAFKNF